MLINTNEVTLSDSQLPLAQTVIAVHTTQNLNNTATSFAIRAQIDFFLTPEKMYESPTNYLRVQGFDGAKKVLNFTYEVEAVDGRYVIDLYNFDVLVKAHIMSCFPTFDPELLVITTQPLVE